MCFQYGVPSANVSRKIICTCNCSISNSFPPFHSWFCSNHEHRLVIAQSCFYTFCLGHGPWLWALVKAGSVSGHLGNGQSRIHQVGICSFQDVPSFTPLKDSQWYRAKSTASCFSLWCGYFDIFQMHFECSSRI